MNRYMVNRRNHKTGVEDTVCIDVPSDRDNLHHSATRWIKEQHPKHLIIYATQVRKYGTDEESTK
jgi:hypothetical protein